MNSKAINYILVFLLAGLAFLLYQENQEKRALSKAYSEFEDQAQAELEALALKFEDAQADRAEQDEILLRIRAERKAFPEALNNAKIKEHEQKTVIYSYDADSLAGFFARRRAEREAAGKN